jgi:hypothetical protein
MNPGEQHLWYAWGYDRNDIFVAFAHPIGANSNFGIHEVKVAVNLVSQEQEDGTIRAFVYVANVGDVRVTGYALDVGFLYP